MWSIIDPSENLALVISVGLLIAIASATQDITVDALRIEQIGENESRSMAAGAAMTVVGWWSGYKLGGVLSLFSAEFLEKAGSKLLAINIFNFRNSYNFNEYWINVCERNKSYRKRKKSKNQ